SSSGCSSLSDSNCSSSSRPSGRSNSASTYASPPPAPTSPASPLPPSRSPIACARTVLPAPVSPVIAFRPGANDSSARRIRTRFSIRRLRSKGLAVPVEEGHLGEEGQQRAPLAEPHAGAATGRELPDRHPVGDHLRRLGTG